MEFSEQVLACGVAMSDFHIFLVSEIQKKIYCTGSLKQTRKKNHGHVFKLLNDLVIFLYFIFIILYDLPRVRPAPN